MSKSNHPKCQTCKHFIPESHNPLLGNCQKNIIRHPKSDAYYYKHYSDEEENIPIKVYKISHPNNTWSFYLAKNIKDAASLIDITPNNIECAEKIEWIPEVRITEEIKKNFKNK